MSQPDAKLVSVIDGIAKSNSGFIRLVKECTLKFTIYGT